MEELLRRIEALLEEKEDEVLISIEGGAGSGKSTLAAALERRYGANVYHMDDFFLPPALRTEERLAQPGGNIHYERFLEEVIEGIMADDVFTYGVFDCKKGCIAHQKEVLYAPLNIMEGVYSAHPFYAEIYDLRVFLDIDPETQKKRITERNGDRAEMFFEKWIPMENRYFEAFRVRENSDIILRL